MTSTKITSVGSTPGDPSPPNGTPNTDASGVEHNTPSPHLDAVGAKLQPIEEELNESAEMALFPSPPYNSPYSFSPAPSTYTGARHRGLSAAADRLSQLKLDEHFANMDGYASSSKGSVTASTAGGDEDNKLEPQSEAKARNQNYQGPTTGTIPLEMGSPLANPLIEEYISFESKDLPVVDPNAKGTSSTAAAAGATGANSEVSDEEDVKFEENLLREGVREKSNWGEELEEIAERILLQMEQLASDEASADPSRTMEECYLSRLSRILANENRAVKLEVRYKW
ncbi:hypothetical protein DM02DRAFT_692050 [Periconia macrospinosa]|uniref:Uncharacterized protein n=1 Tax=Periconia macrospinosa TaxID=97972 RepID=A0A2V1D9U5_9PLEO|nr:hypothetical protein DM02DRAFT_692050 [Periconia macrospinosa]